MKFESITNLRLEGFTGFVTVQELTFDYSRIPKDKGVYLVILPENVASEFISIGSGGHFKGKNPNVDIKELKANWVEGAIVLYIGKATSLKQRIGQYLKFGQGKNIGHYGGRYIWQLKNSRDLLICWKTIAEDPREYEYQLIREFYNSYGSRPFANLKD